jgi:hypothetical protein
MKILLVVLGVIIVASAFYYFVYFNKPSADVNTVSPQSAVWVVTVDPANLSVNRTISNHALIATYSSDVSALIKTTDVAINTVNADGSETAVPGTFQMNFLNNGTQVLITISNDFVPATIYHFTIKPTGTLSIGPVDVKFLTEATTALATVGVSQGNDGRFTLTKDAPAKCTIDLYQGADRKMNLYTGLSYTTCSADMYTTKGNDTLSIPPAGSVGLNPVTKTQALRLLSDLHTISDYTSGTYSVSVSATNSLGTKKFRLDNISHIDPVRLSVTKTGTNTYNFVSEILRGVDGRPINGAGIAVTIKHNGLKSTTATYTTTAGKITIPLTVDGINSELIDFTANYKIGTVNLPVINNKFLLLNY